MFGDAKIQQAHAAIVLDQNVGRLQIAMDDGLAMRMLHGFADQAKQLQALRDGKIMFPAISRQRSALTLWPHGEGQPTVSTLNAYDGFINSNMAIVPTNDGSIDAYAAGLTQLYPGYFRLLRTIGAIAIGRHRLLAAPGAVHGRPAQILCRKYKPRIPPNARRIRT